MTEGPEPRQSIPPATSAALWTLSNGRCYASGCPFPVVFEVRPGVYRKNVQIAHIYGVKPGTPRHKPMPAAQRESFANLLLLCMPHHADVDDRKIGEHEYPADKLFKWKYDREGSDSDALSVLAIKDERDEDILPVPRKDLYAANPEA
jgi:hypothetical protein